MHIPIHFGPIRNQTFQSSYKYSTRKLEIKIYSTSNKAQESKYRVHYSNRKSKD